MNLACQFSLLSTTEAIYVGEVGEPQVREDRARHRSFSNSWPCLHFPSILALMHCFRTCQVHITPSQIPPPGVPLQGLPGAIGSLPPRSGDANPTLQGCLPVRECGAVAANRQGMMPGRRGPSDEESV